MCCRDQGFPVGKAGRLWLTAVLLVIAILAAIPNAIAGDRTNVPLKNWGGFQEFRDDLERLVTTPLCATHPDLPLTLSIIWAAVIAANRS